MARTTVDGLASELGQEQRDDHVRQQEQDVQRHAAEQLDVDDREPPDQRQLRAPAEGEEQPEREAERDPGHGEDEVEHQPAPVADLEGLAQASTAATPDDDEHAEHDERPGAGGEQRADQPSEDAAGDGAGDDQPRPDRRRHRHDQAAADDQRPQPEGDVEHAAPPRALVEVRVRPPGDPSPLGDEAGDGADEERDHGDRDADAPQLVGGVAPDHEELEVGADDLPATGHEEVAQAAVGDVEHDGGGDDGDDAVADRAEEVAPDPVGRTLRRARARARAAGPP